MKSDIKNDHHRCRLETKMALNQPRNIAFPFDLLVRRRKNEVSSIHGLCVHMRAMANETA